MPSSGTLQGVCVAMVHIKGAVLQKQLDHDSVVATNCGVQRGAAIRHSPAHL